SAGITAFKAYVAESRARYTNWTMVSEAAVHDAEKRSRALGDARPVTRADLWRRVAEDMTEKPYRALAIDLVEAARKRRDLAVDIFLRQAHQIERSGLVGLNIGKELQDRARANRVRKTLGRSLAALDAALQRNETMARTLARDATDLCGHCATRARRPVEKSSR
ncbi:MAG: conjugal transfer protein TraA, partial [Aliidongia sp.]